MSGMSRYAVAADIVFDGKSKHDDFAVVIEDGQIAALTRRSDVPSSVEIYTVPKGTWLAPGFIDIQVNGGGDVLFNADPTPAALAKISEAHRKYGVTALLPTLITDDDETMAAALGAVSAIMAHEPSILGIHLEGPFLSPDKPGVHRQEFIRRPQSYHRQMLGSFREGALLVTLAPEEMPDGFIAELVAAGAKVSLGHSMATYEETRAAMAEGLTGFTHLFNAMRQLSAREPGPIAAALESSNAYYGLIVDGEHVAPAMLGLAMRGAGRPMLVSDAMPPVGGI
ncbi:MAG: N-acetylglucosamine-6-phosphate deacetylase [Methylocystis sp.]